ncbi:MAG: hypothetical protein OXH85_13315 [Truepera sp.]|nr:hypothetical protein [Truepera sp.]
MYEINVVGWLGEEETVPGSKADGAFDRLSADTLISGFELQFKAGNWGLVAAAELGWTLPEYGSGIISELSGLTTTYFLPARYSPTDRHRSTDLLPFPTPPTGTGSGYPEPTGRPCQGR